MAEEYASISDEQLDRLSDVIPWTVLKEMSDTYWHLPPNYKIHLCTKTTENIKETFLYKWRRSSEPNNKICNFKQMCMEMKDDERIGQELYDDIKSVLMTEIGMLNSSYSSDTRFIASILV